MGSCAATNRLITETAFRPVDETDETDEIHGVDDGVDVHSCPVCQVDVVRSIYQAGRPRVYCTNACRQKAYRWRKAHGIRLCVDRTGPTGRMVNNKRHAVRDTRDPVGRVHDRRAREVAVCGAFAGRVEPDRATHTNFIPDHPFSCARCADLVGSSIPYHGIPSHLLGIVTFPPRGAPPETRPVGWPPWPIR